MYLIIAGDQINFVCPISVVKGQKEDIKCDFVLLDRVLNSSLAEEFAIT
jgi:hypothetical protein